MKVLKAFEHDGKRYEPGDEIAATVLKDPRARQFLERKGCIGPEKRMAK